MTGPIQYLTNRQIDKIKWDDCIERSGNGLIYACSFYLDHMAKYWDALVLGDYEAVMPLTWNSKFGIRYLYQPFLTAQLGVFGKKVTGKEAALFIQSIPASFRFVDIYLNSSNLSTDSSSLFIDRHNYVLDLSAPYEVLHKAYRSNIQRNIKKAIQAGCKIQRDIDVEKVIEAALEQMRSQNQESTDNVNRFRKLYAYLHERNMAISYAVVSAQQELLASCVFFFFHNRSYYILVGNPANGKTTGASHALIDAFIKDHAGKNMLLDFEGSDIPTLALFYRGFGAKQEIYPALKINRLPFYLKWLKK